MGLDSASPQTTSASPQMSAARTILVMAGGTGGHVMPALAVAERMRNAGWRVVWLGSKDGMEATLIPKHGYEMQWIRFSGVRGKGFIRLALLPLNLLVAFWQSARVIFRVRPDVVLGMGGYVSFPGAMMASLFDRPLVVHEQNSVAGLANRVLASVADRILSGFPGVLKKSQWVGNPVRESITRLAHPTTRYASRPDPLQVLVLGGSLGAQALNEVVPAAMSLVPEGRRPTITHQSGVKHLEQLRRRYEQAGVHVDATAFIDDMAAQYARADLVICRAGALTVSELAAAG